MYGIDMSFEMAELNYFTCFNLVPYDFYKTMSYVTTKKFQYCDEIKSVSYVATSTR